MYKYFCHTKNSSFCKGPMSIANAVSENCFTLASQLVIECDFCEEKNKILASLHTGIGNFFNELQKNRNVEKSRFRN